MNKTPLNMFVALLAFISLFAHSVDSVAASNESATATKVLFISAAHSNRAKVSLLKKVAETHSVEWSITHKSTRELKDLEQVKQLFNQHEFIVLDGVSKNESEKSYQGYLELIANSKNVFFTPSWLSQQAAQKGITNEQQNTLRDYWKNAGRINLTNMLSYISAKVLVAATSNKDSSNKDSSKTQSALDIAKPIIFPLKGIYHPQQPNLIVDDLDKYFAWKTPKENQPKVALLFQRANIEIEQTTLIDETIKRFEEKGVHVVPFFFKLSPGEHNYDELLYTAENSETPAVDLIINFRNIHWANQRKLEFEQFGVPVLQALTYYSGNKEAWEADEQGIAAGMMAFTLVLPETAGVTDPMIVAAMDRRTAKVEVIDYQLQHLVNKAFNLTQLKYKPNRDKKLTMFVWGDQDVGASFMNVPESVASITQALIKQDYSLQPHDADHFVARINKILDPFYRDYELNELLDEDLAELMPIADYLHWFKTLPQTLQTQVNERWGQPQDNFMAIKRDGTDYFVLPRFRNGNMLVMRQPPRSDDKNDESGMFHNGITPINHFYLAAYYYARSYWNSDAIIHLGTHGSQEWLGGKERGLSMFDQGNLAVWDTPIVYPFIVDDVGEAMQTKRRGRATTISHMTPPFSAAGLHGEIAILHELMHQYKSLDEGGVKDKTAKQIVEKCITENLCKDIGWEQDAINADFPTFFDELHEHMHTLASANQPLGLHTFGELSEQKLLTSTVIQMLGKDFVQYAGEFERKYYKLDNSEKHSESEGKTHDSHSYYDTDINASADVKKEAKDVDKLVGYTTAVNYIVKPVLQITGVNQPVPLQELDTELQELIKKGKTQFTGISNIRELKSMTDFLAGKYIPVKNGGDPIRHPDAVPTGYNLIGFDPSKVPTKAAYEQGKELIDQLVADHYKKHGQYPDKLAFSLWSIETMRHYGVLEAQAMYAMGVKPTWTPSGRITGTEIIPYSELKRPRIDVVLSATGLYRDAFPNVMQMLAKAVKDIAKLKEDSNPIWKNSQRVKQELLAEGVSEEDAEYLSTVRVFSNQSGDYGSGTDALAWASDKWDDDKIIAENYMKKMGYYFGADRSRWGKKITDSQGKAINLYGKQLSGTDVALFSRSSNLYGMITSDDPFEYFGSLSLAVRALDGKSPEMRISNLRDTNNMKSQDAASFMSTELRTRNFHPRWITEMQKEGYSGAVTMSSNMDNFFGWQVVDPNIVRSDQWDEFFDVYVDDKLELGLDEWFEKTNPEALARMMQRMLEAQRKEYWDASPERLQKLVETYSEFVEKYNLFVDNEKLKENVKKLAAGFGLSVPKFSVTANQMAMEASAASSANAPAEQVSGQKLEEQKQSNDSTEDDYTIWYVLFGIGLIFFAGWYYEQLINRKLAQLHD